MICGVEKADQRALAACGGLWQRIGCPLETFAQLKACSLEAWGQNARQPVAACGDGLHAGARMPGNLWQPVGTDWMPSNKPLLDAGGLQPGGLGPECPATCGNLWRAWIHEAGDEDADE